MQAKQRFPWIPVSAAAAALVVGVVAWLQIPATAPAAKSGLQMPALTLTRPDPSPGAAVLAEQLAAYDPTPLFLPTAMNSGQKVVSFGEQANAGGPFADLSPRLVFGKDQLDLAFPPLVVVPSGPVQGLTFANRREMPLALGRVEVAGKALPSRAGYVEAVKNGENRAVLALALPETPRQPQGDWQPMELLGAVSSSGLVGDLVVTVSSGSDTVDDYFSQQLAQIVRVGERLSPGFYTFRVGP